MFLPIHRACRADTARMESLTLQCMLACMEPPTYCTQVGLFKASSQCNEWAAGIEVACNLLDTSTTEPEAVLEAIDSHARKHGISVGAAYTTNHTPDALCRLAAEQMALASA